MPRRTVLCAIENRDLARIFEKALKGEGYRVHLVHDGEQALLTAREELPDVFVLDISLPRRDGFSVLEAVRAGGNGGGQTPVILLSNGRITPQYQQRADAIGADRMLAKPVPLDILLRELGALFKEDSSPAQPRVQMSGGFGKAEPRAPDTPRPLVGTFSELPFPQLLHQLHGLRASGVLMLANAKKRKAIQLRDGYPIAIRSNLVQECLGNYLQREGLLDDDQHRESVSRMKRGEGLQGEILIAMQVLDEVALARALRDQALEKLFEIFEWRRGEFRLEQGGRLRRANLLRLDTSPANVILVGVRGRYPIEAIDHHLQSHRDRFPAPTSSPFYRFQEVHLSDEEGRVLSGLDGRQPLGRFSKGAEETRRAIFGLLMTGMLELQEQPGQEGGEALDNAPEPSAAGPLPQARHEDSSLRRELTNLAEELRGSSHYERLGIEKLFTDVDLEAAYSRLGRRVHPDRFSNAGQGVRELAGELEALVDQTYETLKDPKLRQVYDLELRKGERVAAEEAESRRALEAETQFQKGQSLVRSRNYQDALYCFGKALERNDGDGEYHAHYGWCLYLCHQDDPAMIEEAIEHVRRGAKLARDRERPYLYLGRLYKVVGNIAAAEKMFTNAIQIQPQSVEALRELRLINLRREKSKGLIQRLLRR